MLRTHLGLFKAFNSVECIEEYLELPSEGVTDPSEIFGRYRLQHPALQGQDLHIRYEDDTPDVLKGISCEVQSRERVGVLGRK